MSISGVTSSNSTQQSSYVNNPIATAAQQLASSQTISSDADVRITLGTAMASTDYESPLQQAWGEVGKSLASGDSTLFFGVGSGDLSAAKSGLDSYMQSLPSSSLYMSALTTPSQAFLSDLQTMSTAINSGDLAGAQTAFNKAETDQPEDVASAMSQADFSGNASEQAQLSVETAANLSGFLTSIGYTQTNANIEGNAMVLGSLTETPTGMTVQSPTLDAQAEKESTAISSLESSTAPTSNQAASITDSAMYKIYDALFAADPYAVRDSNMNANSERGAVLNQLFSSMSGQDSGSSAAAGAVNVSV